MSYMTKKNLRTSRKQGQWNVYLSPELKKRVRAVIRAINASAENRKQATGPTEITAVALERFVSLEMNEIRRILAERARPAPVPKPSADADMDYVVHVDADGTQGA